MESGGKKLFIFALICFSSISESNPLRKLLYGQATQLLPAKDDCVKQLTQMERWANDHLLARGVDLGRMREALDLALETGSGLTVERLPAYFGIDPEAVRALTGQLGDAATDTLAVLNLARIGVRGLIDKSQMGEIVLPQTTFPWILDGDNRFMIGRDFGFKVTTRRLPSSAITYKIVVESFFEAGLEPTLYMNAGQDPRDHYSVEVTLFNGNDFLDGRRLIVGDSYANPGIEIFEKAVSPITVLKVSLTPKAGGPGATTVLSAARWTTTAGRESRLDVRRKPDPLFSVPIHPLR